MMTIGNDGGSRISGTSTSQWNSLLNLIYSHSNTNKFSGKLQNVYSLESGYSHHMTGRIDFLNNVKLVCPYTIGLLNGSVVVAVEQTSMCLGPKLTTKYVIFILDLKCHLIFLGQLLDNVDYFITLYYGLCAIPDHISRTLIEVGEQTNEIFLYRPLNLPSLSAGSAHSSCSRILWHMRLGYCSNLVVDKLLWKVFYF